MADYNAAPWDTAIEARFWSKVEKLGDQDCWLWRGTLTPGGYAQFSIRNRHYAAHRLLKIKMGADGAGLVCDHLCRNRACVNPAHIEMVTNRENVKRGIGPDMLRARNRSVTHCPRGHEYTAENTRFSGAKRFCRACSKIYNDGLTARRRLARAHAERNG